MTETSDMQPPNDDQQLCAFCEEQPAVEAYKLGDGRTLMICAACGVRHRVRDALESRRNHILTLADDGKVDEALACLDEIWQANRDNDHDLWLARNVASERASILTDAGRFVEAERALNEWAQLGFAHGRERMFHARATA